jgi:hypothetical protein
VMPISSVMIRLGIWGPAVLADLQELVTWSFASAETTASTSTATWKRQIAEQIAPAARLAPDGPLEVRPTGYGSHGPLARVAYRLSMAVDGALTTVADPAVTLPIAGQPIGSPENAMVAPRQTVVVIKQSLQRTDLLLPRCLRGRGSY